MSQNREFGDLKKIWAFPIHISTLQPYEGDSTLDAFLNQAEETATEADVRKGTLSPETVTIYKDSFSVHNQLNQEHRSLAGTKVGQTMTGACPWPQGDLLRRLYSMQLSS